MNLGLNLPSVIDGPHNLCLNEYFDSCEKDKIEFHFLERGFWAYMRFFRLYPDYQRWRQPSKYKQ